MTYLTHKEIPEHLDISEEAVNKQIKRAPTAIAAGAFLFFTFLSARLWGF